MKTFKQFLSESHQFEIERFKTDCALFLEQLKGSHGSALLYRGSAFPPTDWDIREWERRTKPRDTLRVYHDAMNEWYKDRMGDEVRNWMFCTGSAPRAQPYAGWTGKPISVIFPIGHVEWVCSRDPELTDMTDYIANLEHEVQKDLAAGIEDEDQGEDQDAIETETIKRLTNKLSSTKFWRSTNLLDCIHSQIEIMFKCDKYYCFADVKGGTLYSPEMQQLLKSL